MHHLKRLFYFFALCFFCTHTSTGQQTFKLRIGSEAGTRITIDTVTKTVPARKMLRFKKAPDVHPLEIVMQNDTQRKTVYINQGSLRRKRMWISMDDTGSTLHFNRPSPKGLITWNIALPFFNQFYARVAPNTDRSGFGIAGIGAGMNYWTDARHFLSLQIGAITNAAGVEYGGDTVNMKRFVNLFASVKYHHNINRFDFGYGISVSQMKWDNYDQTSTASEPVMLYNERFKSTGVGGSFSCYFHPTRVFVVGLLYQPQFISFDNGLLLRYHHTISIDCMVRLTRNRKYVYN